MQLLNSFAVIASILSLAVSAADSYTGATFPIRVWRDPRSAISFNHQIELDPRSGDAIINKTAGYPGFPSYIDPSPFGKLYGKVSEDRTLQAFLVPLPDVSATPPTHYQLRFSKKIPKVSGVLFTNFTTVGRGCGGNCGGTTLDYGIGGDRQYGEWYVIRDEKKAGQDEENPVWKVRWIALSSWSESLNYPEGALPVYTWAF